jgi:diguanylate cyclase (GGDEF)-like protein
LALCDAGAGRPSAAAAAADAIAALPSLMSAHDIHEYELALFVAAELEAASGHTAGLRCAQHQLAVRNRHRLAAVGAMRNRIEVERRSHEYDALKRRVHIDALTGIGNRSALERYLGTLRHGGVESVALVMVDMDKLKAVNDHFGHAAGDAALVDIARLLEASIGPADIAVRYGGDEFVMILAGADLSGALDRAEEVIARVEGHPWGATHPGLHVTVSIGLAVGDPVDIGELGRYADRALYEAKTRAGNSVVSDQMV